MKEGFTWSPWSSVLSDLYSRDWLSGGLAGPAHLPPFSCPSPPPNQARWVGGWSQPPAVGGTPGAAKPAGCGDPRERGSSGPLQAQPSLPAPRRPGSGGISCARPAPVAVACRWLCGPGLGCTRREAAPRGRVGVSGAAVRAGEGEGTGLAEGTVASVSTAVTRADVPAAPFLSLAVAPGSQEPVFCPDFAWLGSAEI